MKQSPHPLNDVPQILYEKDTVARAGEGQCDCACAGAVPAASVTLPLQRMGRYQLRRPRPIIPLGDGYDAAMTEQVSVVVLNQTALGMAHFFDRPQMLADVPEQWYRTWGAEIVDASLRELVQVGMLVPVEQRGRSLVEATTTLTAWLHVTDRCNLRCAYCYLPHKREDMPEDVGRAAIEATFRSAARHGYRKVKLKYAGGEPLIRFATIVELHGYAQKVAGENGVELDAVVLSNGTLLTAEIVAAMKALGLRLMISVDGLGRFHDSQRVYAGGHGTFADVARGVELALNLGLAPDISVTVSGANVAGLPEVVAWILDHDLPFSLNFYRENDLSASQAELQLQEAEIIDGMLAAFRVIEANLPDRSLVASLVDRANLAVPHLRTCGVGDSYLVFDYQGGVAKCQMHLQQIVTNVMVADPLLAIRADEHGIQNLTADEKEGCRSCQWKDWCTGGCPLVTFRATGRYDVKSPNCNIYKALFPEVVRLEGLRLLREAIPKT